MVKLHHLMASSSKPKRIYHVFLSFRGTDVRNNFLVHLYTALDMKGIYTYVDSEELRKGEKIGPSLMKAIEESHMAVIIFSEDYASSPWCLEEVAKIMECKEERNLMVFPVFYKVEPREVRTPRERYREAMVKHESKFGENSDKVKRWKQALLDAGSLSGWQLQDGDDSEHIQRIVKEITVHLGRTPLHVAKHPVGIESRVVKLKSMLNLESDDDVLMVGLWGQGGIGKSTLARALYNAIFRQFEGSCLLANVREAQNSKDLISLQENMLSQILSLQQKLEVSSVERGINLIQHRLCHKKVLLILDDVDNLCQLNALAGKDKWFGNGSRIIITTRNIHLLTYLGIAPAQVYNVSELNPREAHQLLCKHAFPTHQKLEIWKDLVDSVLNYAKGLPLALEVLGSFLYNRKEDEWKSTLKKLSRVLDKKIFGVLKISYDGLEKDQQEIFLHIASFFKGWDNEYLKKILESCDFEATIELKVLFERSLISIDGVKLQMHDLIQSMGMYIVRQECDGYLGRRSRLWLYEDVVDVLSSDMGDCAIKAIVLELPKPTEMCISPYAFTRMRRLRLLILRNVHNSSQGPIFLPNELRWFEWLGCADQILEFSSGPQKLVGLNMSKCNITVEPKEFKGFQNLKYINVSDCKSLVRMPDLLCTPKLEELRLCNCENMVEAHESLAYHDKLRVLNFSGCSELSVFPKELKSKNLKTLILDGCTKFEKFPEIPHKLEALKYLSLVRTSIKGLPTSIENLVSLKFIYIDDCKKLEHLPSSIYKLQKLICLDIQDCPNLIRFPKYEDLDNPCMKTGLSNLCRLDVSRCNLFEVEFLENISCCPRLGEVILDNNNIPTSINTRKRLERLRIGECHQLQEIPELSPSLTYLYADNCESLRKDEDLTSSHRFFRGNWADMVDFLHEGNTPSFSITQYVNGERLKADGFSFSPFCSEHIYVNYLSPYYMWEGIDFAQMDSPLVLFGVEVKGRIVKKWGLRIICEQLRDDLKAKLQDNQLIDPALLDEVDNESIDSEAESSHVHEDNLSEANLQEDSQDCQTSAGSS